MNGNNELVIGIKGAGGIGSNLACILYPALQQGQLVEKIGDIRIRIYDSDIVEKNNLPHQKKLPSNQLILASSIINKTIRTVIAMIIAFPANNMSSSFMISPFCPDKEY